MAKEVLGAFLCFGESGIERVATYLWAQHGLSHQTMLGASDTSILVQKVMKNSGLEEFWNKQGKKLLLAILEEERFKLHSFVRSQWQLLLGEFCKRAVKLLVSLPLDPGEYFATSLAEADDPYSTLQLLSKKLAGSHSHTSLPPNTAQALLSGRVFGSFYKALSESQSKTQLCLFVSSTFVDTKFEQDAFLVKVFPCLKAACFNLGLDFNVVSMRWGVRAKGLAYP